MMKKTVTITALSLGLFAFSGAAALAGNACLHGTAKWSSGDKIDGSTRVSTSWNGKTAYPKNGKYKLCLGSNPGKRITVYVDGSTYTEVYVDGDTRLDIVRR